MRARVSRCDLGSHLRELCPQVRSFAERRPAGTSVPTAKDGESPPGVSPRHSASPSLQIVQLREHIAHGCAF